jgi:hypothetical protein
VFDFIQISVVDIAGAESQRDNVEYVKIIDNYIDTTKT